VSKPVIYQVLTRLWGNGKFSAFDKKSFDYLGSLGVTHIWYTGIIRHASGESFVKGDPGCPYSISDYYDVNPYLAKDEDKRISEFKNLIKRTHNAGMKVIIDFIPNHVACNYSDSHGGIPHHDYCDYDWTDTLKINYSDPKTWRTMKDIVLYWLDMGVDGFRCDMVELVPRDFFRELIAEAKAAHPDTVFVAEVYDKNNYYDYVNRVGFDYLYDKSGLYDSLMSIMRHGGSAEQITWNWQFLGDMQPRMLNFLENHDEVRAGSRDFCGTARRTFAPLAVSALFNTAAFMVYFGGELGDTAPESSNCRTSIFNWTKVGAFKAPDEKVLGKYRECLALAGRKAFSEGSVHDLGYCSSFDRRHYFAWLRYDDEEMYLIVTNFTDSDAVVPVYNPLSGQHHEVAVGACDYTVMKLK